MRQRDDFPQSVKRALALRAGYQCSFEGCSVLTVGPSDESPLAVSQIGVAAHIRAAAAGGKRYLATMTAEQRSSIENAIWLCANHGTLVDRDDVAYTPERLHAMRQAHETRISRAVADGGSGVLSELIAFGPNVIALGTMVGGQSGAWSFRLEHFVAGDFAALLEFGERLHALPVGERYVLVSSLGDGRVARPPLTWRREGTALAVELPVEPSASRVRAQELGPDIPIDLVTEDLSLSAEFVSGIKALPQRIRICLWTQRGESLSTGDFGTRIAEFFHLFGNSPWFAELVKLEVIRMAAIPHRDSWSGDESTPFQCVSRVRGLTLLAEVPVEQRLPVRIELDVNGIGLWTDEIRLWVRKFPFEPPPDLSALALLVENS